MDPNRDFKDCCFSLNEESAIAYNDYHRMIETCFAQKLLFKQALLIDLHGQSHPENWIELGYLLSSNDLEKELNVTQKSSLHSLVASSGATLETLVRGPTSLGSLMTNKFNMRVVPSSYIPSPQTNNYYSGGYISRRYTSKEFLKYRINSIQIELPYSMRQNNCLELNAKKVASCIFDFYTIHSFDQRI